MQYEVKAVQDEAGMAQLGEAWARLLNASPAGTVFSSFPWNIAWWHAFESGKRPYVLLASDSAGQVCGIAPLMLHQSGLVRKLEFIGTGLSDTGDFVLDASCAEPVAGAIFAYLQEHSREWDLLDMDEVPSYSLMASYLETNRPDGLRMLQVPRTDCPYIPLPATWEEYTQTLQRKPRQHLEAFSRRVVEETGAYFRVVTHEEDAAAAVARFYELHRARWEVKEGELNPEHLTPAFLSFLQESCTRAASDGLLRLCELWAGDKVVSSWISFMVNGRLNGYMTGFDPEWSNKRPGKILHGFVVKQALSEKARELDFGRGAEGYKYEMGAVNRKNSRFVVASNTPRSALAYGKAMLRIQASAVVHRSGSKDAPDAEKK